MTTIATISDLLTQSNSHFSVYDIGRKIDKITKADFLKIELNQLPYPFPLQGHAFLAIVFWQKNNTEPYLWFVKLPLDERGLLNQAARNHFIAIIIEALGASVMQQPSPAQEKKLQENPYHFTPSQYKLASLNSLIKVKLKQPPSQYYETARCYITGQLPWQQWQNIAIQGLTDIAARLNYDDNSTAIAQNIHHYADEVLIPLCSALENQPLSLNLIEGIITLFHQKTNAPLTQQYLLRALASSSTHPYVINLITQILSAESVDDDLYIAISARCWLALQNEKLLMLFLEKLVTSQDKSLFNAIFKDLVAIGSIRPILFRCMRAPNRSKTLAAAIGQLFNQLGA
jgi:hypothetical protein